MLMSDLNRVGSLKKKKNVLSSDLSSTIGKVFVFN